MEDVNDEKRIDWADVVIISVSVFVVCMALVLLLIEMFWDQICAKIGLELLEQTFGPLTSAM